MKSRLLILLTFVVMVAALAALNAASYVRVEEEAETEFAPDRSTENAGGTGTRALFEYLRRRGTDVARWRVLSETVELPGPDALPDDAENMTRGVPLLAPAQPTALTRDVFEVTRSRFAARLHVLSAPPPP